MEGAEVTAAVVCVVEGARVGRVGSAGRSGRRRLGRWRRVVRVGGVVRRVRWCNRGRGGLPGAASSSLPPSCEKARGRASDVRRNLVHTPQRTAIGPLRERGGELSAAARPLRRPGRAAVEAPFDLRPLFGDLFPPTLEVPVGRAALTIQLFTHTLVSSPMR